MSCASRQPPLCVVLLGASGFVGAAVLRRLAEVAAARPGACHVRILQHRTAMPQTLPPWASVYAGSITRLPADLIPEAPHVVVQCAAKQIDSDGRGFGVNLQGIEHLAGAIKIQTRAVLFLSSMSVYGDGAQRCVSEDAPLRPESALARSRAECEARLARMASNSSCRAVALRTRFVLGTGDRYVLPGLAKLAGSRFEIGSGQQRYSVIDVDDLARILVAFAQRHLREDRVPERFESFNVGYERPISLREIRSVLDQTVPTQTARWRVPVHEAPLRLLARAPSARLRQLAQRLSLIGLDHYANVSRLQGRLKNGWLQTDPAEVVRRAARQLTVGLRANPHEKQNNHE